MSCCALAAMVSAGISRRRRDWRCRRCPERTKVLRSSNEMMDLSAVLRSNLQVQVLRLLLDVRLA